MRPAAQPAADLSYRLADKVIKAMKLNLSPIAIFDDSKIASATFEASFKARSRRPPQ
jgi:hypothetical protein